VDEKKYKEIKEKFTEFYELCKEPIVWEAIVFYTELIECPPDVIKRLKKEVIEDSEKEEIVDVKSRLRLIKENNNEP